MKRLLEAAAVCSICFMVPFFLGDKNPLFMFWGGMIYAHYIAFRRGGKNES